jgi:hypothetical protein
VDKHIVILEGVRTELVTDARGNNVKIIIHVVDCRSLLSYSEPMLKATCSNVDVIITV